MRSDTVLLGILETLVSETEGCDFLDVGNYELTQEEINHIRALGGTYDHTTSSKEA
jgi:hypothetical protein